MAADTKSKAAAAKEKEQPAEPAQGQGRAVVLPNGEKRVDYIRRRYYDDKTTRSDIRKEINEMLEKAERGSEVIPYQIVFAATKEKTDPRKRQEAATS